MDAEALGTLALILLYFIVQALAGRKRPKQQAPPRPAPQRRPAPARSPAPGQAEPTLEDALREIREALGMPQEAPPAPRPAPPEAAGRRVETAPPRRVEPRQTEGRRVEPVIREAEGRRLEQATPETVTPETVGIPVAPPVLHGWADAEWHPAQALPHPAPAKAPAEAAAPAANPLLRRLHEPGSLREAVLLAEVLGPPKALRR